MCLIAFYQYNIHKILAWFFAVPFYFFAVYLILLFYLVGLFF